MTSLVDLNTPTVFVQYAPREAISTAVAARIAGVHRRTIIEWSDRYGIGRKVAGRWKVSRVALAMHLAGDKEALAAYLLGDREPDRMVAYFRRCGVPLPRQEHTTDDCRVASLSGLNSARESV
jgi:hypothetical protein